MTAAPTKAARLAREQSAASRQKYTLEGETSSTLGLAKEWEREAACDVGDWLVVNYESPPREPPSAILMCRSMCLDVCSLARLPPYWMELANRGTPSTCNWCDGRDKRPALLQL